MKLIIEGFRVYRERVTFHLPDEGLTLLYGDNGIGKTTLLKALVYVLFGSVPFLFILLEVIVQVASSFIQLPFRQIQLHVSRNDRVCAGLYFD
jgi:DNA repair exonuclease SbcCD ATPase subunit